MQNINFSLDKIDFSIYDEKIHDWKEIFGNFQVYIGSSSRDIFLEGLLVHKKI